MCEEFKVAHAVLPGSFACPKRPKSQAKPPAPQVPYPGIADLSIPESKRYNHPKRLNGIERVRPRAGSRQFQTGRPGRVAATDGNEYKRRTLSPVETARAKRGLPVPTYATLAAWESSA